LPLFIGIVVGSYAVGRTRALTRYTTAPTIPIPALPGNAFHSLPPMRGKHTTRLLPRARHHMGRKRGIFYTHHYLGIASLPAARDSGARANLILGLAPARAFSLVAEHDMRTLAIISGFYPVGLIGTQQGRDRTPPYRLGGMPLLMVGLLCVWLV